jgi:hypothetical protein
MGIFYRGRQFWRGLRARPTRQGMAEAQEVLTPDLYNLFVRLQPSELAHTINVFRAVREQSQDPELLAAALLHDIGKIVVPLALWEKIFIVLARNLGLESFFDRFNRGGRDTKTSGFSRGLVVAERHPPRGAEQAHQAGATRMVVQLIRPPQDPFAPNLESRGAQLLAILQAADAEN